MGVSSGCYSCLKFLVFIVNFLFWLLGLGVIAVSLWLLFDDHLYLQTVESERADYYTGTYLVLGIGSLMTIVGFLGCCGAWKESPWMLGTFFVFLILIVVGEVCAGVLIYFERESLESLIGNSVRKTVLEKYHHNNTAAITTFDILQGELECCGADGPTDWATSIFNEYTEKDREIGIASPRTYNIPVSCCRVPEATSCRTATQLGRDEKPSSVFLYIEGCSGKMVKFMEYNLIYLMASGVGILVLEFLGMLFSMCLCCAIRKIDNMKA